MTCMAHERAPSPGTMPVDIAMTGFARTIFLCPRHARRAAAQPGHRSRPWQMARLRRPGPAHGRGGGRHSPARMVRAYRRMVGGEQGRARDCAADAGLHDRYEGTGRRRNDVARTLAALRLARGEWGGERKACARARDPTIIHSTRAGGSSLPFRASR